MTALIPLLQSPLAEAIGRALVHLIWQASLVALALGGLLAAMRRSSSNARYAVSCLALVLTVALPLATGAMAYRGSSVPDPHSSPRIADASLPSGVQTTAGAPSPAAGIETVRSPLASMPLDPALPFVVGFWLTGVLLLSARIALALVSARRLADSGLETLPRVWNTTLARLTDAMGIDRAVRMLESTRVDVPTVIGWMRPVILVPASALSGLTPQQLETVLAHELAHIRRHDYLVNLAQTVVETLLFYHPAVWWISNRVRVEREHCCDDVAVELCGDAVGYARALATLEELRSTRVPSPALAATGGSLLERVRRLVGLADDDLESTRPIAALIVLMIISAAIAIPLSARGGRAGDESGTTITVDETRDEVTGIWVDSDTPAVAGDESQDAADLDELLAHSELDEAELERQGAYVERQLADVERQRAYVERAVHEALAEGESIEWKIASALEPLPPTPAAAPGAPTVVPALPAQTPLAPRAWRALPVTAPGTPAPLALPAPPSAVVAPAAPAPHVPPTPRPAVAPLAFVDSGRPVNASNPTVDDLIILHSAGVDAGYVREMSKAGFDRLTARQLAALSATGVDAEYARAMQSAIGRKLLWSELLRLHALGIDEDDIEELREAGGKVDVEGLTRLRGVGVHRAELDRLRASIDRTAPPAEIGRLRSHEVDAEYAAELRNAGLDKLSAREYELLESIGVDGDYVREMRAAGIEHLDATTLYQLKATGVDADWLKEVHAARYATFSTSGLVSLHAAGVEGGYLRELSTAGFAGLSVEQIMRLHAAGIDAHELREWKAK